MPRESQAWKRQSIGVGVSRCPIDDDCPPEPRANFGYVEPRPKVAESRRNRDGDNGHTTANHRPHGRRARQAELEANWKASS